jgi:hypothetical protein
MFSKTYDAFYYENWLDKYLNCDKGILENKPSFDEYIAKVTRVSCDKLPFFKELKEREQFHKKEKHTIVNNSIAQYLQLYGKEIDTELFSNKLTDTQTGKLFVMWKNNAFHLDTIAEPEMLNLSFQSIKKNNTIIIQSTSGTSYNLLLRWRNNKGILNPAWQISMKRFVSVLK